MSPTTRIMSGSPYEARFGFSRAVRVDQTIEISGTAPIRPDGGCDPGARAQARCCLEIVLDALARAGGTPEDVVRTRIYITSPHVADEVGAVHAEVFGAIRPASTMVVVAALLDPRWLVEIEATARLSARTELESPA